ncbi:MAG: hypothetical protein KAT05_13820 [Spirochaetes bacterium]|nr:hypothetical protein [Spirochaetota bacterium]
MTNEFTIPTSDHKFTWIDINFKSDEIDISEFLTDGDFDKYAMQKAIIEELMKSHQETFNWQNIAILKAFPTD